MSAAPSARALLVGLLSLVLTTVGIAHAQEGSNRSQGPELTVGGRMWGTSGYSDRKIGAGGLDRLSELRFRGVDSLVPEFNVDVVWRRLVALGTIGGGIIETGVLLDEDFATSGERIGRTRSPIEDSYLFYVSTDIGARVWDWTVPGALTRGYIDLLLGYQYWQEHYEAFGATGFPATVPDGVKALLNKYEWHSLRVGVRTRQPLYRGLSLSLRGYYIPWNFLVIKDVHYLRSDLRRDPSFRDEADGGTGWQAEGGLQYAVNAHLTVEAGFRYWKVESAKGEEIAFTTVGTFQQRLREASTERYGPFVGVRWRFRPARNGAYALTDCSSGERAATRCSRNGRRQACDGPPCVAPGQEVHGARAVARRTDDRGRSPRLPTPQTSHAARRRGAGTRVR